MCDTLVSLTDDGVLFAKNSDRDPNESQVLEWQPAADHRAGSVVRCTWLTIDQAPHTNAVLLSRPWWMWGAEIGTNEHGLVIGNEAVFTRSAREGDPGLLGMDLLRLALERCADRHSAVQEIVRLLELHGQGGPCSFEHGRFTYDNSFIVADPDGAVVLETAGRTHATEEVNSRGRSISNGLTIAAFARAHSDPLRSRVADAAVRRSQTQDMAVGADGVLDLFAALRSHGPGRARPRYSPLNGALSAPCAHAGGLLTSTQTTASWVADLRSQPQHWATGTAAPCTSLFKPVRVSEPVDLGPAPANVFDPHSLWWRHEVLHRAVMRNPGALLTRYRSERDDLERHWSLEPPASAEAFRSADELTAIWSERVDEAIAAKAAPDVRPWIVRRLWRRWDEAAAIRG